MDYLFHLMVLTGIYGLAAIGLDFFAGRVGVLSVCQGALMGVGAYTSALLVTQIGAPWWVGLIAAALVAGLLGPCVGLVSLRARGDYFVVATLALQAMFVNIANSWHSLTGGPFGLRAIPKPSVAGRALASPLEYLILVSLVLAVVVAGVSWLEKSAFLPSVRAGRDDALLLVSSGKNWDLLRLHSYAIGGALGGVAGGLLAHYVTFIDASTFSIEESVFVLTVVLVGGMDRVWGPLVGAVVLTGLPELLRSVAVESSNVFFLRTGLMGLALILVVLVRPTGLVGRFSPARPRYD